MNINLLWTKGIVRELRAIRNELSRLADCWEVELSEKGFNMRPPRADTRGPEPTISYTDEEADFIREMTDKQKGDENE